MIERILPRSVVAREHFGDMADAVLFPEEEQRIATAVVKRRREFATVRHLAREALRELGLPSVPILPGPDREPLWPVDAVGSMTHCEGYRAAAICRSGALASLGIDAEPNAPLPEGVLDVVSLPEELPQLAELAMSRPDVHGDRLLFCVKEAVYKAWFPLAERWLGFEDVRISFHDGHRFTVTLLVPEPADRPGWGRQHHGNWQLEHGLLTVAIAVAAPPQRHGAPDAPGRGEK
ncbi:4'-phosphopantetheinyl transferase family protein [Streptomyces sp. NPDC054932]